MTSQRKFDPNNISASANVETQIKVGKANILLGKH
jgi:hypothetical protein